MVTSNYPNSKTPFLMGLAYGYSCGCLFKLVTELNIITVVLFVSLMDEFH